MLLYQNLLQNIGWGGIYQRPSSLSYWVSWTILIIKGTESASSLEMKSWVIFKRGALNFWWTVTETGITTTQKSHPLTDRDRHLWMISSNPLPSNFLPCPLIKTHPFASCFQFSAIMPLTGHCLAGHQLSNTKMQDRGVWNIKLYNVKDMHVLCHIQWWTQIGLLSLLKQELYYIINTWNEGMLNGSYHFPESL